ncbi:MAG TPA: FAD/NAD(P)-binding oxidoreductase [Acidimicrobiales bacterium]|nr:FAD/NAD(P)-binding oxidoreductase [Acidimicrobiales bacterium]
MVQRVVILGGGTGGTLVANRLRHLLAATEAEITVIDQDDLHIYQPGLLFVPFGLVKVARLVRSRSGQLDSGVAFRQVGVDHVDIDHDQVVLADGSHLGYDVLVVATGAALRPEETEGLTGPGWRDRVHTFYDLAGATALSGAMAGFRGGRLVVNVVDMPIKCPVAPIEFVFLADWYFRRRGMRDRVELVYATPLDGVFTREVADRELAALLRRRDIEVVHEFNTGEVDGARGRLVGYDDRQVAFDLAVVVPLHAGAACIEHSPGLSSELGFVPADPATLRAKARPNVFVIGDAADLPSAKAGSVAHFQGDVVARNVAHTLAGEMLEAGFDGHTNCFIETGAGKAVLIDYNYDTEPLPGHYPGPVGLPLLRESRTNHLAKLLFEQFYWHVLLPGRPVPGVTAAMPTAGKDLRAVGSRAREETAGGY